MQDILGQTPRNMVQIQSYSADGFRLNGAWHHTPLLLAATAFYPWSGELSESALGPLLSYQPAIELLLIGGGRAPEPIAAQLRQWLSARGVGVDSMDTGAACRTYSVLLREGRRVGAALRLHGA